jgi:hypothetical protein
MGRGMLWNRGDANPQGVATWVTGLTRGANPSEVCFALQLGAAGALLFLDLATGRERRVLHKESFMATDLDRHPSQPKIVFSNAYPNGTSNLAIIEDNAPGIHELTEGDSLDEAPSWIPGSDDRLVYQSSGIGRDANGVRGQVGPAAIHTLDVATGHIETILEDENSDFLEPKFDAAGALYYIRRPYEERARAMSLWRLALDVVAMPYRVVRSVFHFLDAFATAFSRKPLITAGGPKRDGPSAASLFIRGRVIDGKRLNDTRGNGDTPIVPSDWVLVRRAALGEEATLASGVVSYDLRPDGTVFFSNGRSVFRLSPGGRPEKLHRDRLVERVVALDAEKGKKGSSPDIGH